MLAHTCLQSTIQVNDFLRVSAAPFVPLTKPLFRATAVSCFAQRLGESLNQRFLPAPNLLKSLFPLFLSIFLRGIFSEPLEKDRTSANVLSFFLSEKNFTIKGR